MGTQPVTHEAAAACRSSAPREGGTRSKQPTLRPADWCDLEGGEGGGGACSEQRAGDAAKPATAGCTSSCEKAEQPPAHKDARTLGPASEGGQEWKGGRTEASGGGRTGEDIG